MKALKENWRLALVAIVLFIIATVITAFPSLQAEALRQNSGQAQGCGKSGHTCYYRRYYTCVLRRGRHVCGYAWFCYCVPNQYRRYPRRW